MIDSAITAGLDLPTILNLVLDQVKTQLHVDACDLLLLDPRTQTLETSASWGFRTAAMGNVHVPLCRHGGAAWLWNIVPCTSPTFAYPMKPSYVPTISPRKGLSLTTRSRCWPRAR